MSGPKYFVKEQKRLSFLRNMGLKTGEGSKVFHTRKLKRIGDIFRAEKELTKGKSRFWGECLLC